MKPKARNQHDKAWKLKFGAPDDVKVELFTDKSKSSKPQTGFADHPMCLNMLKDIEAELEKDQSIANTMFEDGWTLLHQEAMAGNLGIVKLLISHGADVSALTPNGYTAALVARKIGWSEIAEYIEEHEKKSD